MRDDAWDDAAIYRKCGRCLEWQPLKAYVATARLCRACMSTWAPKRIGPQRTRTIVITPSGRELLRQLRIEEAVA